MCADQHHHHHHIYFRLPEGHKSPLNVFVSRWIPSNLNVETRSIAPDEVKRGGIIEVRGPRITAFRRSIGMTSVKACELVADVQAEPDAEN